MTEAWTDDGHPRCTWARFERDSPANRLYRDYHDFEWGVPLRGPDAMFERMCLEAFQSGLAWITVLRKREHFRRAFDGFRVERVAAFGETDVARLLGDSGIVRNRAKIEAAIANARVAAGLDTPLDELIWTFAPPPRPRPRHPAEIPATSAESVALAKELKRRGFRFVGPTTAYALMQATGMVDDHLADCWVGGDAHRAAAAITFRTQVSAMIGDREE
ncbi:MAG TPA: DNA-3-methyladenine glycosylase I [Nocardia sp.]|uniref:DNA-3-methyladenine glycosylase I n=1 Tax=Nocardia TaxID=1817 RepID=UPI002455E3E0|nr:MULTISPECIES: DNA-3-methyladenine glycosylase I [Nocardia]HLS76265.1 DNA-3-methyladenine glycosylase I [Nocardia sp.]